MFDESWEMFLGKTLGATIPDQLEVVKESWSGASEKAQRVELAVQARQSEFNS